MIQLHVENGRLMLEVICDVCHEPITDARMAMVRFKGPEKEGDTSSDFIFCHKQQCDEKLNKTRPMDGWWELRHFIYRLAHNAGMKPEVFEQVREEIQDLSQLH